MDKPDPSRSLFAPRWMPAWIFLFAVIYYASYYRCGFNLADEGNVALISQRLLAGEQPFKDIAIGYNVGWFYPIMALFALFGPNLVVMKVYFFSIAALTALLAYLSVWIATKNRWIGLGVGLLLVLIPGTPWRSYIPLLSVSNGCLLLLAASLSLRNWRFWSAAFTGSLVLGLTFLIRVEIGWFVLIVWLGLVAFRVFDRELSIMMKVPFMACAVALIIAPAWAIQVPSYLEARRHGYDNQFVMQYAAYYRMIAGYLHLPRRLFLLPLTHDERVHPRLPAQTQAPLAASTPKASVFQIGAKDAGNLARRPLRDVWKQHHWEKRTLPLLTYAPFVSLGLLLIWAAIDSLAKFRSKQSKPGADLLKTGVLVGSALTVFPQFFLFRPDMGHLSEFMPGCLVAMACGGCLIANGILRPVTKASAPALVAMALLSLHAGIYISYALPQRYAGTIAARVGRNKLFKAENGVSVYVNDEEFEGLSGMQKAIQSNSKPGDYVVCYPYAPGINFMTNRPTYEHWLYVDNVAKPTNWEETAIANFRDKKPAAIVISDWSINRTPESMFSNWAPNAKRYIEENYCEQGTYLKNTVYTRKAVPAGG